MSATRAFPAFSVGFGTMYLVSLYFHPTFTYFTYAPRLGRWFWGVPDLQSRGPGMYWWSWLATAAIAGVVFGIVALVLPENLRAKVWIGWVWVVPVVLTVVLTYIERTWFGFK